MKTFWGLNRYESILAILGIVFFIYEVFYGINYEYQLKYNYEYAIGKVVESYIDSNGLMLVYEFSVKGEIYRNKRIEDGRVLSKVGDIYRVRYSKSDPYINRMMLYDP